MRQEAEQFGGRLAVRGVGGDPPVVLLGGAREKLTAESMGDVFVTDSIEPHADGWAPLHVVAVSLLLAQGIRDAGGWR